MSLPIYRPLHESGYGRLGLKPPKYRRPRVHQTIINRRPLSLFQLAQQDVGPAYKGQRTLVQQLLAQADADQQRQSQYMGNIYAQLAKYITSIAPNIQNIYKEAGDRTAAYAHGEQMGMQLSEQTSASDVSQTLKNIGAPAGQAPPDYGAADRLYALTGYNPAAELANAGAGWASYAATLPGIYSRQGLSDIATMLGEKEKKKQDLRNKLLEIGANESADVLKQVENLRSRREQSRQFNQQMREKRAEFKAEMAYRVAVARASNLYNAGKLTQARDSLDQAIAKEKNRHAEAVRRNDISAAKASQSRLDRLRKQRADAERKRHNKAVEKETKRHNKAAEKNKKGSGSDSGL